MKLTHIKDGSRTRVILEDEDMGGWPRVSFELKVTAEADNRIDAEAAAKTQLEILRKNIDRYLATLLA